MLGVSANVTASQIIYSCRQDFTQSEMVQLVVLDCGNLAVGHCIVSSIDRVVMSDLLTTESLLVIASKGRGILLDLDVYALPTSQSGYRPTSHNVHLVNTCSGFVVDHPYHHPCMISLLPRKMHKQNSFHIPARE